MNRIPLDLARLQATNEPLSMSDRNTAGFFSVERDPSRLSGGSRPSSNIRGRLPHGAVADALATVRASQAAVTTKRAFEFLVLTAARSGEVRLATDRWLSLSEPDERLLPSLTGGCVSSRPEVPATGTQGAGLASGQRAGVGPAGTVTARERSGLAYDRPGPNWQQATGSTRPTAHRIRDR